MTNEVVDLEIYYNKSVKNLERLVWHGNDLPFDITQCEIRPDYNDGYSYKISVEFCGGVLTLHPRTLNFIDTSPPPEICECCGQEKP